MQTISPPAPALIYPFVSIFGHAKIADASGVFRSFPGSRMPLDWAAQQLRFSLFSDRAVFVSEKDWQTITGQEEAENRIGIPGGKSYTGKVMGGQLGLTFSGPRVDIILSALDEPSMEPRLPAIGPWADLATAFQVAATAYLEKVDFPIIRIAFGAILLAQTDGREDAYNKLAKLLQSLKVDPKNSKELTYSINWPRESKVFPGLELNRITHWSSMLIRRNLMQMTGSQMSVVVEGTEFHTVRLEMDHNTAQDNTKPFEKARIIPIFEELVTMARQNADAGERP
jgi:hypothetical protein